MSRLPGNGIGWPRAQYVENHQDSSRTLIAEPWNKPWALRGILDTVDCRNFALKMQSVYWTAYNTGSNFVSGDGETS